MRDTAGARALLALAMLCTTALVPLLTACETDGGDVPTSAPTTEAPPGNIQPAEGLPADRPSDEPTDDGLSFSKHYGDWGLVFTDVRVAAHGDFDRIVLEFGGRGKPGWSVQYVDKAALEGSGRVVRLGGDAVLNISASGITWPAPGYYSGPKRIETVNGGQVNELYVGGTFEGYTQVLAGVEGRRVPFRVFTLTHPSRLVIDVGDA